MNAAAYPMCVCPLSPWEEHCVTRISRRDSACGEGTQEICYHSVPWLGRVSETVSHRLSCTIFTFCPIPTYISTAGGLLPRLSIYIEPPPEPSVPGASQHSTLRMEAVSGRELDRRERDSMSTGGSMHAAQPARGMLVGTYLSW